MALDVKSYFANIPKTQRYCWSSRRGRRADGILLPDESLWEEKGRHEETLQKLQADLQQKQLIAANRPKLERRSRRWRNSWPRPWSASRGEGDSDAADPGEHARAAERTGLPPLPAGGAGKKGFYAEMPFEMRVEGSTMRWGLPGPRQQARADRQRLGHQGDSLAPRRSGPSGRSHDRGGYEGDDLHVPREGRVCQCAAK